MTEPAHARVLDPRWHQMNDAVRQFWEALGCSDRVDGMNLTVTSEGGQVISYAVVAGERELRRRLITDPDAVAAAMAGASVDLTPEAGAA